MAQKPKRSGAGSLSERVVFCEPNMTPDGYGGITQGYVERFTDAARLTPRMGGEAVQAARLAGTQPYSLVVRSHTATRAVTPEWRVRNVRTNATYNIRAVSNPDERNQYLEMLIVAGEAG